MPYQARKRRVSHATLRAYKRRKAYVRTRKYKNTGRRYQRAPFARKVMSVVNKNAEVKSFMTNICTDTTLNNNQIHCLWNNAFELSVGGSEGQRVGQKVYLKGLKVAINIEAQQYRPKTFVWVYLIRNKRAPDTDITTAAQMFEGIQNRVANDFIDKERVDILWAKKFTLLMPNVGTALSHNTGAGTTPDPPYTFDHESASGALWTVSGNPKVCKKFYIPLNFSVRYRDYEDGSTDREIPATYRYQWVCVGYDAYNTPVVGETYHTTYPLGHITMNQKLLFTDV